MGGTIRQRKRRPTLRGLGPRSPRHYVTVLLASVVISAVVPVSSGAVPTAAPFIPGEGTAQAQIVTVGFGLGGVNVPVRVGTADAMYVSSNARASAGLLDLGVLELLGGTSLCEGQPPPIPPGSLPAPLRADSDNGDATTTTDTAGDSGAGIGHAEVSVRTGSLAVAESRLTNTGVVGLIDFGNGVARSEAELVPDSARRATASTELSAVSLLDGLVTIDGMRWDAEHRSGDGAHASGDFVIGSLKILGLPVPVDSPAQLAAAITQITNLLAPFAMRIEWPAVASTDDGVTVSPLRVQIGDGSLVAPLIRPLAGSSQQLRQVVTDLLIGNGCSDGGGLGGPQMAMLAGLTVTIADVVLGMLAGHQRLTLDLGGIAVSTGGVAFDNPFGTGTVPHVPPLTSPLPRTEVTPAPAPPTSSSPVAAAAPAAEVAPPVAPPTVFAGASSLLCRTTSAVEAPGCWGGRAGLAGLLSLVSLAVLFGVDLAASRRNRLAVWEGTATP